MILVKKHRKRFKKEGGYWKSMLVQGRKEYPLLYRIGKNNI